MTSPLARRRKPRTTLGKLIRAWPQIRLAIRAARLIAKARVAIRAALFTLALVAIGRLIRRRRRSRGTEPLTNYAPPPVPTAVPQPAQPVAEAETETKRKLQAEK